MAALAAYLYLFAERAQWLMLMLLAGAIIGDVLGNRLQARGHAFLAALERKLNRAQRSPATLVYRGIIALAMLLLPAGLMAAILGTSVIATSVTLVLWFGHALSFYALIALWRRARTNTVPLESTDTPYLFADSHAVLRHEVLTRSRRFAVAVVGAAFWYVLAGVIGMLAYLTVSAAARHFPSLAFGWAARSLFALLDAAPRLLAALLMLLAGLLTPGARPAAALAARNWQAFTAQLMDVALGGPGPHGTLPWVGTGTARLSDRHLRRFVHLLAVATLLLVLLLGSAQAHNLLNIINSIASV